MFRLHNYVLQKNAATVILHNPVLKSRKNLSLVQQIMKVFNTYSLAQQLFSNSLPRSLEIWLYRHSSVRNTTRVARFSLTTGRGCEIRLPDPGWELLEI